MELTYKEAYDKIIDAYFKDEIKPMDAEFCFCGTLNNNSSNWKVADYGYSYRDFKMMESALLIRLSDFYIVNINKGRDVEHSFWVGSVCETGEEYENALFNGMCAALDVLKQIHLDRGEIIDEPIKFKKRELQSL